ncbi:MAG TPA: SAM-dependent methyltransferase [Methylomirabilota bacterium]|nr:SAM-dependent methyltransferase [Methylomirabilota bacterium]
MRELVAEALRAAIEDHGPIGFDEFMELALYGPGGFYEEPRVGAEGDFVTSPAVHAVFARLLGAGLGELHELLGRPAPLRLTEVGAGDGTLAAGLLQALAGTDLLYTAVERSPGALEALRALGGPIVAEQLPASSDLVLAHELLDNLPFRLLRGGLEVRVGLEGDRFVERRTVPDGELIGLVGDTPLEGETVVPTGALAFIDLVAARLADPGYVLLIDYGGVGEPGGPVHGYRAHRIVDDPFVDPGSADITAGIDLAMVSRRAESHGLVAYPPVSQRHVLTSLGFEAWIKDELARQAEHLADSRGAEAVRTWSGRSRATLLVDPTALGRMRWLLLATEGMPAPSFIA